MRLQVSQGSTAPKLQAGWQPGLVFWLLHQPGGGRKALLIPGGSLLGLEQRGECLPSAPALDHGRHTPGCSRQPLCLGSLLTGVGAVIPAEPVGQRKGDRVLPFQVKALVQSMAYPIRLKNPEEL